MIAWLKRFLDCWRLARRIQRGDLIAVKPIPVSAIASQIQNAWLSRPAEAPIPELPDVVEVEEAVEVATPHRYAVVLVRDGQRKLLYAGDDDREAKTHLNRPARAGAVVELWDRNFDPPLCRGHRET